MNSRLLSKKLIIEENNTLKKDVDALRKMNSAQETEIFEYRYGDMTSEHELRNLDQVWLPHECRMSVRELHEITHEI
jgi:hypothetical protein